MQINAGGRIAQLLFPYIQSKAAPVERTRALGSTGKHGFGQTVVTDQRLVSFIWELNGQRQCRNSESGLKFLQHNAIKRQPNYEAGKISDKHLQKTDPHGQQAHEKNNQHQLLQGTLKPQ